MPVGVAVHAACAVRAAAGGGDVGVLHFGQPTPQISPGASPSQASRKSLLPLAVDDPRSARQGLASVLTISPFGVVDQSEFRKLMGYADDVARRLDRDRDRLTGSTKTVCNATRTYLRPGW